MTQTIRSKVDWTEYDVTVTKKGNQSLLVTYHTSFEDVKQWLFPGSRDMLEWWSARTKLSIPSDMHEALSLCRVGKLLPTEEVYFVRQGRWPKITGTKVGRYPKEFAKWLSDVRDALGDVEILAVRS